MEGEEEDHVEPVPVSAKSSVVEETLEGVFTFVDGSRYEGQYVLVGGQRKRSGKGTMIQGPEVRWSARARARPRRDAPVDVARPLPPRRAQTSEGDWENDSMHGFGKCSFATGATYEARGGVRPLRRLGAPRPKANQRERERARARPRRDAVPAA